MGISFCPFVRKKARQKKKSSLFSFISASADVFSPFSRSLAIGVMGNSGRKGRDTRCLLREHSSAVRSRWETWVPFYLRANRHVGDNSAAGRGRVLRVSSSPSIQLSFELDTDYAYLSIYTMKTGENQDTFISGKYSFPEHTGSHTLFLLKEAHEEKRSFLRLPRRIEQK